MGDVSEYSVELLGLVEVTLSLADFGQKGRVEVAEKCYAAITAQQPISHACLGRVIKDNRHVGLVLDHDNIKVYDGSSLITDHRNTSVSTIASIRQSNGSLVYIGKCQRKKERVAVVLNMGSEDATDQLVYHFLEMREKRRSQGQPVEPLPSPKETSPAARPTLQANPSTIPTLNKVRLPGSVKLPTFTPRHKAQTNKPLSPPTPAVSSTTLSPPPETLSSSPCFPPPLPPKPRAASGRPLPAIPDKPSTKQDNVYSTVDDIQSCSIATMNKQPTVANEYSLAAQALHPPSKTSSPLGVITPPRLSPKPGSASDRPLPAIPINNTPSKNQGDNIYSTVGEGVSCNDNTLKTQPTVADEYNLAAQTLCTPPIPGSPMDVVTPIPEQTTAPTTQVKSLDLNDDADSGDYYITIGIKAAESESIYMTSSAPWRQGAVGSTDENIRHFMTDEQNYLTSIKNVKEARKFMPPELQNLLRRIDALVDIHESMYKELTSGHSSCAKIAKVFISRQKQLEPYKYYMRNSPRISKRLDHLPQSLLDKYPTLKEDVRRSWTRLHYYFMFLGTILDSTSKEEKEIVHEALEMLRRMNLEVDAGCHIDAIKEAPFNLESLGTLLLHSSFFVKEISRLRSRGECKVFLFREMIILTVPELNNFMFYEQLPIKQLHFLSTEANSKTEFVLELVMGGLKKNKKFTFQTQEDEKREAWVTEITRLMNENAENLKRILARRYSYDKGT